MKFLEAIPVGDYLLQVSKLIQSEDKMIGCGKMLMQLSVCNKFLKDVTFIKHYWIKEMKI
ncbi:hypothetical protein [Virgibacillus halodenitrificans]|uniref:hypothetical protein n=1 Tax=Virgibacillus halodenitrificans TaxID=1482 RepID=UPI000985D530|nr:hypothetical protein [Virgibacillus halodenitrificans]